jgi:superfamily II DNA/RNA helicase
MSTGIKNQAEILSKLRIEKLNPMQEKAKNTIHSNENTIILSPTGTGKTLAFLLPLIAELDPKNDQIQALILAPTRELAIQIEQVIREMGSGYKANAVYGGRAGAKDRMELKTLPAILIGTPGRVADRIYRDQFSLEHISTLILDEFDKSLEIGFEEEMGEIIGQLKHLKKRVLTSATKAEHLPDFVGMENPVEINFLDEKIQELKILSVPTPTKDKLDSMIDLIAMQGSKTGIIFCNFKESIVRVSEYLKRQNIAHGTFHGSMEQQDRERALIQFRNGSHQLLLATDLAARGIDVPEIDFIIHYHLPHRAQEFTHRNGRTARMNSAGSAYVLHWKNENLPDFITDLNLDTYDVITQERSEVIEDEASNTTWTTLFISGGRKDKISKGDIVGLLAKTGGISGDEIGNIELKQECSFVAVADKNIDALLEKVNNQKLKKKKVRVRRM